MASLFSTALAGSDGSSDGEPSPLLARGDGVVAEDVPAAPRTVGGVNDFATPLRRTRKQMDARFVQPAAPRALGEGGFGTVEVRVDKKTRDDVAWKVIETHDRSKMLSALREVAVHLTLSTDPACADFFSCMRAFTLPAEVADGAEAVIVTDLVDGETLKERMDAPTGDKTERVAFARRLLATLLAQLVFMRDNGVLHRDIKPANILVERATGIPFLADFGLACLLRDVGDECGALVGTTAFMDYGMVAWLVDRGEDTGQKEWERVRATSDLLAVGLVVFFAAHVGDLPYTGAALAEFEDLRDGASITTFMDGLRDLADENNLFLSADTDDDALNDVIDAMLVFEPAERLDVDAVVYMFNETFPDAPVPVVERRAGADEDTENVGPPPPR